MKTEEILAGAKKEIEHRGWCKGVAVDEQAHVCMLGAIAAYVDQDLLIWNGSLHDGALEDKFFDPRQPWARAVMALACAIDPRHAAETGESLSYASFMEAHTAVAHQNDRRATTLQDVYNYFDKALAELGALHG